VGRILSASKILTLLLVTQSFYFIGCVAVNKEAVENLNSQPPAETQPVGKSGPEFYFDATLKECVNQDGEKGLNPNSIGPCSDFSNKDLSGLNLADKDLRGSDFTRAILANTDLRRSLLDGAHFNYADLRTALLDGASLANAVFDNALMPTVAEAPIVSAPAVLEEVVNVEPPALDQPENNEQEPPVASVPQPEEPQQTLPPVEPVAETPIETPVETPAETPAVPVVAAPPVVAPPAEPVWVACAQEHGSCDFTGTTIVRYGLNGVYASKEITNGTACSNQVFGDPVYGFLKYCEYLKAPGVTDSASAVAADPRVWTKCANENGYCAFSGTAVVRYGVNGKYYFKNAVTNGIACNNKTWGDPNWGYFKACEYTELVSP
jgi:hypothetical protein